jgi:hypothetical protein
MLVTIPECSYQAQGNFALEQRFSNFFQVGTTFISQNVLRTTLLLSPMKANLSFFLMFSAYGNTNILILLK